MKTQLAVLATVLASASAFAPSSADQRSSTALKDDEDNAMWIDDGSGGRASAAPKKPEPKKDTKKAPKKGGFKFPWDN
ncbi:hypothetical protein THAOC_35131 [Thalassiosira oceanica]|uniref:RxLR effector protein n=1 Tax=Thalassiosira oceanica TaxID=159749 RepID=K0R1D9_THAOC|nr:hypothetical protein THAOC_35131 [Thalassiosira oceanica]|eukprot:EJK46213.1 hypothetical protein THAOC_35131 [Thalassiosira oceanica]